MKIVLQKLIGAAIHPLSWIDSDSFRRSLFLPIVLILVFVALIGHSDAFQVGVKVPTGFVIEKVAGDGLATDVYCLAVGSRGEVFVSGPGYIRQLLDWDGDGIFEESKLFADSPSSGAQGMWYGDGVLLCTGDGGLWQFPDRDLNGVADGKPKLIMKMTTNGEHTAHAIRKHQDGWFYLLAGNATAIRDEYFDGKFSPIKSPHAGFLMRMSPDFKDREIVAHGFRNAYDFDFNTAGEIFVYDSDGERDISLPCYRPTRVFRIQPGDDAGWVSEGWKRSSCFFDMPEELGALGRGSPTGVHCNRAGSFPAEFDEAVFVADWTFGRIHVFRKEPASGEYDRGSDFAIADGQFGFAVTDMAAAQDGSLLVSVGGRGTAGAVYRISAVPDFKRKKPAIVPPLSPRLRDPFCLRTEWSRYQAVSILKTLVDDSPALRTVALESLVGRLENISATDDELTKLLVAGIEKNLASFEPQLAKLVYRISSELDRARLSQINTADLPKASQLVIELASAQVEEESEQARIRLIEGVARSLADGQADRLAICRVGQLALGGCGPASVPEMFKGYSSQLPLLSFDGTIAVGILLADAIQLAIVQGDKEGAMEIGRLAAMLRLREQRLLEVLVDQIGDESNPVEDIHWLNCIAQTEADFSPATSTRIARTLVKLDAKIEAANLRIDRNWALRMRKLTRSLFQLDSQIAEEVQAQISGRDGQVYLFDELPNELKNRASSAFAARIVDDWKHATPNQLRVAASGNSSRTKTLWRKAAEFEHLREVAILALALDPQIDDRSLMIEGLKSRNNALIKHSAMAICKIAIEPDPNEQLAAFKSASRMGWSKEEVDVRDQLMRLLQMQTSRDFGYESKSYGKQQTAVLKRWSDLLRSKYEKRFDEMISNEPLVKLSRQLEQMDWQKGNVERGSQIYQRLQCALCHDGGSRLGPRLEGVTKRFQREDLFRTIISPSRQIPERYRATIVETVDGLMYKGTIIYESVDGITLQDVNGTTIRINHGDIESKVKSATSLMPAGLLDQLEFSQWADLYAYLRTL